MTRTHEPDESRERRAAMLRTAMGPAIAEALADPLVVEVMVNPDGLLRLDRLGEGRSQTEVSLTPGEVERVIRLVASHMRQEAHANNPIVSAELPPRDEGEAGERRETASRASRRAVGDSEAAQGDSGETAEVPRQDSRVHVRHRLP